MPMNETQIMFKTTVIGSSKEAVYEKAMEEAKEFYGDEPFVCVMIQVTGYHVDLLDRNSSMFSGEAFFENELQVDIPVPYTTTDKGLV